VRGFRPTLILTLAPVGGRSFVSGPDQFKAA
jgi:hypothetical protein